MISFGETIRAAREAKGLSVSDVARRTHILVQTIEEMEHENFKRIPAAIYGRGFVRHICECLELDPQPLVAAFMEIYQGRRPPVTATPFPAAPAAKPAPPAEPPAPAVEGPTSAIEPPTPAAEPSPLATELPSPAVEANPNEALALDIFAPPAPPPPAPPTAHRAQDIFSASYPPVDAPRGPSAAEKFRNSLSVVSHGVLGSVRRIPRSAWRLALLAGGALAVLILIIWGCVILYRITEQPVATGPTTIAPAAPTTPPPPAKNVPLRSTGEKIPPLYVD